MVTLSLRRRFSSRFGNALVENLTVLLIRKQFGCGIRLHTTCRAQNSQSEMMMVCMAVPCGGASGVRVVEYTTKSKPFDDYDYRVMYLLDSGGRYRLLLDLLAVVLVVVMLVINLV